MYSQEDKDQLSAQHVTQDGAQPPAGCGSISTERIMRAVEEHRRVSQQLEDLRLQQKRRTARLRTVGLKLMGILWCLTGALVVSFALILLLQPVLFERLVNSLDDAIAIIVMVTEQIKLGLSLNPSASWLLSVAALVVVLLTGLWIRLMRYPQDA
jgi:succinyl-CoA synthetase alpha subunit